MTLCVAVQKLCNERARLSAAIIISIIHVTSATVLLDSIIIIIIIIKPVGTAHWVKPAYKRYGVLFILLVLE